MNEDSIQKEKEFHNERFGHEVDPREPLKKYYAIAQSSWDYYWGLIRADCKDKRILEYGCGTGSNAFRLAEKGVVVTGIDISDVAIEQAQKIADSKNLNATFAVMNAEQLDLSEHSFDIICGSGILHHLDLKKSYSELARVLTPKGKAIFVEPLGHNPLINLYRRLTPKLRTSDEHPLRNNDIEMAKNFFGLIELKFFYLTALLAIPFRKYRYFNKILTFCESCDKFLFSRCPFLRQYAWAVVITLCEPKSTSG